MRVTFLLRRDALKKPGGDSAKVARYREELSAHGVESVVIYDRRELSATQPDLVHLVNLDLPLENYANAVAARRLRVPIALSTICHPMRGIEQMYTLGQDRLYRKLRRFGVPASLGVASREVAKLTHRRDLAPLGRVASYESAQHRLLDSVDLILTMAPSEALSIRRRFGNRLIVDVPNGFSFARRLDRGGESHEYDFISVGRIEPRKNSLELVEVASRTEYSLLIVGRPNENHPEYVAAFLRAVANSSRVVYAGELGHTSVREALDSSDVYINPAWFEVVSQADFEAASRGLRIATTENSYVGDFLSDTVSRFDPADLLKDGPGLLEHSFRSAAPSEVPTERSWETVAADLFRAYQMILSPAGDGPQR